MIPLNIIDLINPPYPFIQVCGQFQRQFPFSLCARPVIYTRPPLNAGSSQVFSAGCFHGRRKGSVLRLRRIPKPETAAFSAPARSSRRPRRHKHTYIDHNQRDRYRPWTTPAHLATTFIIRASGSVFDLPLLLLLRLPARARFAAHYPDQVQAAFRFRVSSSLPKPL
jgi:hypothetical protein